MTDVMDKLPMELLEPPRADRLPVGTVDAVMQRLFPIKSKYHDDPVGWAESKGIFLWSKQKKILRSIVGHRYTSVPSCHDAGKSFVAAVAVCWWLDTRPVGDAFVVTTAPSDHQVKSILWREIDALHKKYNLKGRTTLDAQWYMGAEERTLVAYGRKPQAYVNTDQAMQAFQGIHAEYVLIVVDEAAGVPSWLYTAVDALATNETARVLAIGNPDDPSSHFEEICRPASGWNTIHIGAKDTPNFSGEWVPEKLKRLLLSKQWVRERVKRWGKKSALFISKVLGRFPDVTTDTLISPAMIRKAWDNDLSDRAIAEPGRYGVDVARFGADETCIYLNRGGVIRIRWQSFKTSVTETVGQVINVLDEDDAGVSELPVIVDDDGIGGGVTDLGRERDLRVVPFNGGRQAMRPTKFINRRSEAWWGFRMLLEEGLIDLDPEDEDLAAQLQGPKYWMDSQGRIHVEPKDKMKKRGLSSPDRADAAVQSTYHAPVEDWDEPDEDERSWDDLAVGMEIDDTPSVAEVEDRADDGTITGDLMGREF